MATLTTLRRCSSPSNWCSRAPRRVKRPGHALVEAALAQVGNVEGNHAARNLEASAEPALKHVDVADAVLERDDGRRSIAVLGDLGRRLGGRAALDAKQDDVGLVERFRAAAIIDIARSKLDRSLVDPPYEAQAMEFDVCRLRARDFTECLTGDGGGVLEVFATDRGDPLATDVIGVARLELDRRTRRVGGCVHLAGHLRSVGKSRGIAA